MPPSPATSTASSTSRSTGHPVTPSTAIPDTLRRATEAEPSPTNSTSSRPGESLSILANASFSNNTGNRKVSGSSSQAPKRNRAVDVLIAEDNPISQKILETLLTRMGCRCICVNDGAEALAASMGDIRKSFGLQGNLRLGNVKLNPD